VLPYSNIILFIDIIYAISTRKYRRRYDDFVRPCI